MSRNCVIVFYDGIPVVSTCNRMLSAELSEYFASITDSRGIENFRFCMLYGWQESDSECRIWKYLQDFSVGVGGTDFCRTRQPHLASPSILPLHFLLYIHTCITLLLASCGLPRHRQLIYAYLKYTLYIYLYTIYPSGHLDATSTTHHPPTFQCETMRASAKPLQSGWVGVICSPSKKNTLEYITGTYKKKQQQSQMKKKHTHQQLHQVRTNEIIHLNTKGKKIIIWRGGHIILINNYILVRCCGRGRKNVTSVPRW